ncbi:MAG: ComEC family competence protein, partial [Bdellovibrionales bacterium]|nr:ComEC family competence protein [Bdellovibrionales bacterium]
MKSKLYSSSFILCLILSYVAGTLWSPWFLPLLWYFTWPLAMLLFFLVCFRASEKWTLPVLFILFFFVGVIRIQAQDYQHIEPGQKTFSALNGKVISFPEWNSQKQYYSFLCQVKSVQNLKNYRQNKNADFIVRVFTKENPPEKGMHIAFSAMLRSPRNFGNDREISLENYYRSRNILFTAFISPKRSWKLAGHPSSYQQFINHIRSSVLVLAGENMTSFTFSIFKSMILGHRLDFDSDSIESFKYLGVLHTLVVSGFHVGLVALLF